MPISIEREIKNQFAKFFEECDWTTFKKAADYFFETSAFLLTKDIKFGPEQYKLLRRNTSKRLYIGIGSELLLKAVYLKNGYCINKPKPGTINPNQYPFQLANINRQDFKDDDTLSLNQLIGKLTIVEQGYQDINIILNGLKISKVFRNKEGHVAIAWHDFVPQNYIDIENSIKEIYKTSFGEVLDIKIAMTDADNPVFKVN